MTFLPRLAFLDDITPTGANASFDNNMSLEERLTIYIEVF